MKFSTSLVKFGSVGDLALELKKALTAIAAGWNVEHHPDGTHGTITADPGGNVALTDESNVFTENQEVQTALLLRNPAAATDQKLWRLRSDQPNLSIMPLTDSASGLCTGEVEVYANLSTGGFLKAFTDVYEKQRPVPMGHWVDFTPSLSANVGTVSLTTNYTSKYSLIGKTMIVSFYWIISITGAPSSLLVALPAGLVESTYTANVGIDQTGATIMLQTAPSGTGVTMYRNTLGTGNWPNGSSTIAGTAIFPLQ